jgi:hypothetical protein
MSSAMPKSLFRSAIIGVVIAVLAGCSAWRLGYGQGAELAYWWLERYIDFDETQEPRAREAIADWFRWHRSTQLPEYAGLLAKAQAEALEPVTPAQICRWADTVQQRVDRAFEQALPPLAEFTRALTPQQLAHLERKYARNLKEMRRDFVQGDPEARREAQIKRVVDRAETLYGRLNDAQRERIVQLTAQSPLDPQGWLAERERRQQDTLQALRRLSADRAGPGEAQAELRRLYGETFRSPREAYRAYQQRLVRYNCDFAAQVHNLATPEQRQAAAKRLKGWEDDARSLAAARHQP